MMIQPYQNNPLTIQPYPSNGGAAPSAPSIPTIQPYPSIAPVQGVSLLDYLTSSTSIPQGVAVGGEMPSIQPYPDSSNGLEALLGHLINTEQPQPTPNSGGNLSIQPYPASPAPPVNPASGEPYGDEFLNNKGKVRMGMVRRAAREPRR